MLKKLSNLIEVRKIVTLVFAGVFSYLSIAGKLSAESVLAILTMVFGYYFGKSTALDSNEKGRLDE